MYTISHVICLSRVEGGVLSNQIRTFSRQKLLSHAHRSNNLKMNGSSYLSAGFLDIEQILDLQLTNHTSDEFKTTDCS